MARFQRFNGKLYPQRQGRKEGAGCWEQGKEGDRESHSPVQEWEA